MKRLRLGVFLVWVCAALAAPLAARADEALLRELRAGAVVLMRHSQTTPGVGDPPGWRLERCESQRNLAPEGTEHARRVGQWFKARQLRVSVVRNSPWCRTRDTATLAFGRHDDWPALSNIFQDRSGADAQAQAVKQYIAAVKPGELVVLVSHGSTIGHIIPGGAGLASGESVVVRRAPQPGAAPLVLGRLTIP
ncbi:MAG: histidine phosphatase family protein [Burkholderiaceae bacterium]|nr:histidine phosphatase family protein [Burkholderiaceae bacterium]